MNRRSRQVRPEGGPRADARQMENAMTTPNKTPRIALVLLVAVGLVLGMTAAEAGKAKVTERHRDPNYKFGFKYFQDWKPIPLQPNETDIVCKFGDEKGKAMRGPNRG